MTQMGAVMSKGTDDIDTTTEWEWVQGFGWVERPVVVAEVIEIRRDEGDRKRA